MTPQTVTRPTLALLLVATAGLAACSSTTETDTGSSHYNNWSSDQYSTRSQPANTTDGRRVSADWSSASADTRILSYLHAKNQEEIAAGNLAQTNSSSDAVKQYGKMLVTDHTEADQQVRGVAGNLNITLMDPASMKMAMAAHRDTMRTDASGNTINRNTTTTDDNIETKDGNRTAYSGHDTATSPPPNTSSNTDSSNANNNLNNDHTKDGNMSGMKGMAGMQPDPLARLRNLRGAEFDKAFLSLMQRGHNEVIAMVQKSQAETHDPQVADLLNKTLPVLQKHEEKATELAHQSSL